MREAVEIGPGRAARPTLTAQPVRRFHLVWDGARLGSVQTPLSLVVLFTLVRDHEVTPERVRQQATRTMARAEEQLFPAEFAAAVARGREMTLETAAQQTLRTLNAWSTVSAVDKPEADDRP